MADIYKFKVRLAELGSERKIEITSASTLAKLGYAVLAAFDADGSHLFEIEFSERHFGYNYENEDGNLIDITTIKLNEFNLSVGDEFNMVYDFGAGWAFSIVMLSAVPMKKGTGTHYPYIVSGKGDGIMEDMFSAEVNNTNSWNIDIANVLYKGNISRLQGTYEEQEI